MESNGERWVDALWVIGAIVCLAARSWVAYDKTLDWNIGRHSPSALRRAMAAGGLWRALIPIAASLVWLVVSLLLWYIPPVSEPSWDAPRPFITLFGFLMVEALMTLGAVKEQLLRRRIRREAAQQITDGAPDLEAMGRELADHQRALAQWYRDLALWAADIAEREGVAGPVPKSSRARSP